MAMKKKILVMIVVMVMMMTLNYEDDSYGCQVLPWNHLSSLLNSFMVKKMVTILMTGDVGNDDDEGDSYGYQVSLRTLLNDLPASPSSCRSALDLQRGSRWSWRKQQLHIFKLIESKHHPQKKHKHIHSQKDTSLADWHKGQTKRCKKFIILQFTWASPSATITAASLK